MEIIKKRIPKFQEIIPVYAVASCMLFGWTFVLFLWNLPSWMKFMSVGQLFSVLSYSVTITFIQTTLLMVVILIIAFVAPSQILRSDFPVKGTIAVSVFLSLVFVRLLSRMVAFSFLPNVLVLLLVSILITIVLINFAVRYDRLRKLVVSAADLLIIFLFPLFPLTVVAILTVIVRNVV